MFNHCPPKEIPNLISVTQPDGKRYYTLPNGNRVPSVTTVVGAKKKQSIMEWRKRVGDQEANRISKVATTRGNRVHLLAERYLKNEPINWLKEMPDAVGMFRSMIKPIQNINNINYQEQALWSEKLNMAGRVDLIAEWDGVLSVIDFKTSSKVKAKEDIIDYFAQECAYAIMMEELTDIPVHQLVTLMAVDGMQEPLVFIEKTEDHINSLLEYIDFYRKNS